MVSVLLQDQKKKLQTQITTERAYVQPDFVAALALIEVLEVLEKIEKQVPAKL